jgi:hypothetical protein
MRHMEHFSARQREHHPRIGIGIFFIVFGAALLIATNDLFHLGSMSRYFTWQTVLIFIGVIMLFNLQFTGGLLMIAGGFWFIMDDYFITIPELVRNFYWPGVIVLIGLSFIISSFFRRK